MKLKLSLLLALSLCLLSGATPQQADNTPIETPYSAAASAVALLSLDEFFAKGSSFGTVYIESNPFIPSGLNQVGKAKAQVLTREELIQLFEGKETAPAMTSIRVETRQEKGEAIYSVTIDYNGVQIKGATRVPLGGSQTYSYRINQGQAVLIKTTSTQY